MKTRIIIITLMLVAIFGTVAFATTGKITNAPSGLILRKEASKAGEVITTLSNGTEIEIIEKTGDWYKVKYNNQEGYLFAEFVKPNEEVAPVAENTEETPAGDANIQKVKSDSSVYIMPNISATVINTLPKDTEITIIETVGNWSYISANGIIGWVRNYRINNEAKAQEVPAETTEETKPTETAPEKQQETTPEVKTETTPSTLKRGYINVDSANVREEANTSSKVVTTLIKGTGVEITGENGDWYKINFQDKITGYVKKDLISGN